jgi:hypothetical protein
MVSPTVASVLIDGPAYQILNLESTPSLLPVFKCNFDDVSDGTYVYDVYKSLINPFPALIGVLSLGI